MRFPAERLYFVLCFLGIL